ncbi:MAG: FtsK/SpoIIIE domain-containing protein [Nakamurella sp.]
MLALSIVPSSRSGLPPVDVEIRAEAGATIGDLAEALGQHLQGSQSRTLFAPTSEGTPWPAHRLIAETSLRNGALVTVEAVPESWLRAGTRRGEPTVTAVIEVLTGPDAGRTFEVAGARIGIGRGSDNTVVLTDPDVSRRHCHLELDGEPSLVDDGSAGGTFVEGRSIRRPTAITFGSSIRLGQTLLVVRSPHRTKPGADTGGLLGPDAITRTPRFGIPVPDAELEVPSAPGKPSKHHFPWAMLAMPLVLGASLMGSMGLGRSMIYLTAWPAALIGGHYIQRRQELKDHQEDIVAWREECREMRAGVEELAVAQRVQAFQDEPEAMDLDRRLHTRQLVWVRTAADTDFLAARVGIGTVDAKTRFKSPDSSGAGELRDEIRALVSETATLPDMPVTPELRSAKVFGIVGDPAKVDGAVRNLLVRLAVNHSPFDVSICAALSPGRRDLEGVLRWLPHSGPLPGGMASVSLGAEEGRRLVESLVEERGDHHVVCVVDEASGVPRRVLESVATSQPHCTIIWLGTSRHHAPAATGILLDLIGGDPADGPSVLMRDRGGVHALDTVDELELGTAWKYARALSGFRDVAATVPPDTALPGAVRITELGSDLEDLDDESTILRRWIGSTGLRAQIGVGVDGLVSLDLREDGPHGLVAGTTGAGKSELLQSLIVSLAANNPPDRLTFLLVDYKGGAAFRECADLPHTVGYITDLTPALVHRALVSMNAELTWREHQLNLYGAKDLLALERDHPEAAPPSMLICVDEFAALLAEVPDFIDGMVSIAQRGRSLGMHMILATQRPSGVISDQIKANTDLRIALRVASPDDSDDVIDSPEAGRISRRTPGRAWIKRTGHGTTELVQVAYVGGREPIAESLSPVRIRPHSAIDAPSAGAFGPGGAGRATGPAVHPRTDLDRLVETVNRAHLASGHDDPRRPWLPALPSDLVLTPRPADDERSGVLVLGTVDDPANQQQIPLEFDLAKAGHVLVHGASGSGKTAALRICALAALAHPGAVPFTIHGIDAAGGGLVALEELPHVGSIVPLAGLERTLRLIRMLKRTVDERNALLAGSGAADVDDLARIGRPVPRMLVLIDNLPSLVDTVDSGNMMRRQHYAMFETVLQEGRRCGVHVIATSPQRGGLAMQLMASFGSRFVLRMTTEDDYSMLGVPTNILDGDSVPGRGLEGKLEAQWADPDSVTGERLVDWCAQWSQRHELTMVRGVPMMPDRVGPNSVPAPVGETIYLGVDADQVAAVGIPLTRRPLLLCGRTRSGRTSVLSAIGQVLRRIDATMPVLAINPRGTGVFDRWGALEITRPDQVVAALEEVLRPRRNAGDGPRAAILVDDVHRWEERWDHDPVVREALGALAKVASDAATGERSDVALVAAAHTDQVREATMQSGLVDALYRSRRAVLLMPSENDGMLAGCDVPGAPLEPLTGVGRGLLVEAGQTRTLQFVTS